MIHFLFAALIALLQCSESFYLIMSPLNNPANSRKPFSDTSLLAKRVSTIGGTLKPSNKVQGYKVFQDFVINSDLRSINIVNAAENFLVPQESIFTKTYPSEKEFDEALFQNRLRPMLEKKMVLCRIFS